MINHILTYNLKWVIAHREHVESLRQNVKAACASNVIATWKRESAIYFHGYRLRP